jgi:Right handed beta helix region
MMRWRPAGWVVLAACLAVAAALAALALTGPTRPSASPAKPRPPAPEPASPPVKVCGNDAILGRGPSSPPRGAVTVPAGDNSNISWGQANTTYWFAPGTHTLGDGEFAQIEPADGDTFIGAPGAILDGRGKNHYAFTGDASKVTIKYLTIQDFGVGSSATSSSGDNGGQGVVNHNSGHGWAMKYLNVQYNAGAGVFMGTSNTISYSCLRDNGEYGIQGLGNDPGRFGATHLTIEHNEISGNNTWDWEKKNAGCGCSGADKFWNVADVRITGNYIHDNHGPGIWADTDNTNFNVQGNYLSYNDGEAVIYETSYNLLLAHNTFIRNALVYGPAIHGLPAPAVYISESGGDGRLPHGYSAAIDITHNTFTDNWAGVVLWENADRYCGSVANTSTDFCTLVNPSVAKISTCKNPGLVRTTPYYDDCRWKTQNVRVSSNYFIFDPKHIGPQCTPANFCGFNGIFSQWGSFPPYKGMAVENDITFDQNNHFTSNSYEGPWRFTIHQQGNVVTWTAWRRGPYRQDAGSTMN